MEKKSREVIKKRRKVYRHREKRDLKRRKQKKAKPNEKKSQDKLKKIIKPWESLNAAEILRPAQFLSIRYSTSPASLSQDWSPTRLARAGCHFRLAFVRPSVWPLVPRIHSCLRHSTARVLFFILIFAYLRERACGGGRGYDKLQGRRSGEGEGLRQRQMSARCSCGGIPNWLRGCIGADESCPEKERFGMRMRQEIKITFSSPSTSPLMRWLPPAHPKRCFSSPRIR